MIVNGYGIEAFANLRGADLCRADLRGANLRGADLCRADLRGAHPRRAHRRAAYLDYSCWPLWCGSRGVKLDSQQIDQLCLHLYWVVGPRTGIAKAIKARAIRAAKKRNVEL
jgi:hypothetical protein